MVTLSLQLCRPLSGAVSPVLPSRTTALNGRFNCAAPFRERLGPQVSTPIPIVHASIVPPPFGSG